MILFSKARLTNKWQITCVKKSRAIRAAEEEVEDK
jgi:hypothetical protein